jgi:hypothetical protein
MTIFAHEHWGAAVRLVKLVQGERHCIAPAAAGAGRPGAALGDYCEADANGVQRSMTSGIRVSVSGSEVKGRAFLKDGGYDDQVYEKLGPGNWRVKTSVHVAAAR